MEGGVFAWVITNVIDPEVIYSNFLALSVAGTLTLWLLGFAFGFRIFQESLKALSAKAAITEAVMSMNKTALNYLGYLTLGIPLFGIIYLFHELYESFGTMQLIHDQMLSARASIFTSEKDHETWISMLLSLGANAGGVITAPIAWILYQLVSMLYIVITQLLDVFFAVGVALAYVWGFIAIATSTLSKPFKLIDGWLMTFLTLVIWAVVDPILLGFVYLMAVGGSEFIVGHYSGGIGAAGITAWYFFASVLMLLVMLFRLMAPFIAVKLASNNSAIDVLGAAAAVPAALGFQQILSRLPGVDNLTESMRPNSEGTRFRDAAFQSAKDAGGMSVADAGRAVRGGLGNMVDKLRPSGGSADVDGGGGGSTDGGGSK